jgi:alkylation response protein AidB-like acyl-CoA dehydrogenase
MHYGSDDQKHCWLPKVAEADVLSCVAYTEPGLGSDFVFSKTSAVQDANEWVINGTKSYVINAGPLAGYYIVLCKTDPSSETAEKGLSTILVEADRLGVETKDVGKRLGGRLMYIGEVQFSQVRVPLENTIGKVNHGFEQVMNCMDETRVLSAAQALGISQGAFDRSFAYVKQREQFGQKIVDFQITQQKLADMATKIMSARLLTYQAALSFKNGHGNGKLCSMAKLHAAKVAVDVCDEAIQLFGGYGYIEEYEVERFFRDAKINDILAGTRITQKNAIARALMKKRTY